MCRTGRESEREREVAVGDGRLQYFAVPAGHLCMFYATFVLAIYFSYTVLQARSGLSKQIKEMFFLKICSVKQV